MTEPVASGAGERASSGSPAELELPPCNVLIAGKTGAGKSTLINALLGRDVAPVGTGPPVTMGFDEYNCPPMRVLDSRGFELGSDANELKRLVKLIDRRALDDDSAIHVAWLCFEGARSRAEKLSIDAVNSVAKRVPVVAVVTQPRTSGEAEQLAADISERSQAREVEIVLAKDWDLTPEIRIEAHGLDRLIEATARQFETEGQRMAFINRQRASLPIQRREAERLYKAWITDAPEVNRLVAYWELHPWEIGIFGPVADSLAAALQALSQPFGAGAALHAQMRDFLQMEMNHPIRSVRGRLMSEQGEGLHDLALRTCEKVGLDYLRAAEMTARRKFNNQRTDPEAVRAIISKAVS